MEKLEISHASQILTSDRHILVLSYLITTVPTKDLEMILVENLHCHQFHIHNNKRNEYQVAMQLV